MKRIIFILATLLAWPPALFAQPAANHARQAGILLDWIAVAEAEGIAYPAGDRWALHAIAAAPGTVASPDKRLDQAGMILLRAWYGKCCGAGRPSNWHIDNGWREADMRAGLAEALAQDRLDAFLHGHQPDHPHFRALAHAYQKESDPERRHILATNLARWRWMPRELGERYILVNIAARELTLWDRGQIVDRRRVIVGKRSTRTPIFSAEVGGVVINPWWDVPTSIAREGIAAMVRRNPAAARARGYVKVGARYRQMPGDNNALGRMKLVMPNRFSVYLHDTSSRSLFEQEERLLSHGCVRVAGAVEFAEILLLDDGWAGDSVATLIEAGATITVDLTRPFPIYIAYFTVAPDPQGHLVELPDVYGRD